VALTEVDFVVRSGEILGLLGANGAGKSTLLNVIGGTVSPTEGAMAIYGEPVEFDSYGPLDARVHGIQRVFQELSTFTNLSVAENFAMTQSTAARQSRRATRQDARRRLKEVFPDTRISPRAPVGDLSLAQRQMVEIARAATAPGLSLLILDEPTSALPAAEAAQLARYVRRRAAEGLAVIYVTHKLDEAVELADRMVVLRDGRVHWEGEGRTATHDGLLAQLGAAVEPPEQPGGSSASRASVGDEVLELKGLSTGDLHDISLRVGRGELVGLAGLEGAGQRSLLQHIFNSRWRSRGALTLKGEAAYVSGDRQREGLLPLWSVGGNVGVSAVGNASRGGVVRPSRLEAISSRWLGEIGLRHRARSNIMELSGGNQQRTLLARALASDASLLLLDDPTRGVDVGAKRDIYEILDRIKAEGRSALFYSTENAEFLKCDRVYVMARGHIAAELEGPQATEDRIVQASYAVPSGVATVESADVDEVALPQTPLSRGLGWLRRLALTRSLPATVLLLAMLITDFTIEPNTRDTIGLELLLQASLWVWPT
jgi:ABC-type sugar transport system ATPase subunit